MLFFSKQSTGRKAFTLLLAALLLATGASGKATLPKLISDGMVLQRGAEVKIWGWAAAGEKVSVAFAGSVYTTSANDSGAWEVKLSGLKAGAPYQMAIVSSDTLTINDKPYVLISGGDTINLEGAWQYQLGARMEPLGRQTFIRWKPVGLYNAMISPLLNYCIKGVIWYQGESNASRPQEYKKLFPVLIQDWRSKWA